MNAYLTVGIVVAILEFAFFMGWLRLKHKVKIKKQCKTKNEMWKRVVIFTIIILVSITLAVSIIAYAIDNKAANADWGSFAIPVLTTYWLIGAPTLLDKLIEYQELLRKSIKSQEA